MIQQFCFVQNKNLKDASLHAEKEFTNRVNKIVLINIVYSNIFVFPFRILKFIQETISLAAMLRISKLIKLCIIYV